MKEIGQSFKESREFMGVTKTEAASDLGITEAQLENLEDGNSNAFKDIFFLKELIKKYCKYLNLSEDEMLDEFNEFVFNLTSKIPIAEIEKEVEKINKEEIKDSPKKIYSPYTLETNKKLKTSRKKFYIISAILIILLLLSVLLFINSRMNI